MEYDVVIVGGGPSGLSTAIKLKQLDSNINVCILEKGSEIGAHILSGNVFETRALDELIPNWKELNAPVKTKVSKEKFLFLGKTKSISWPNWKSCCARFIYCGWDLRGYSAPCRNERKQSNCCYKQRRRSTNF